MMLSPTMYRCQANRAARVSKRFDLVIQLRGRGSRIEAMPKQVFDVCIVGSGPGGGIATYALAKAGLKVALVEAGPRLRAGVDYNSHGSPFSTLDQRLSKSLQPGGGSWSLVYGPSRAQPFHRGRRSS